MNLLKTKRKAEKVTIDIPEGIVRFQNFEFTTKFVGNKKNDLVELPFTEILKSKRWRHRSEDFFDIWTSVGKTIVDQDCTKDFERFKTDIETIIETNRKELEDYEERIRNIPKPKIPWWGWLIFLGGSFLVIYYQWNHYL